VLKQGDIDKLFAAFKLHRFADVRDRCAMQVMYASALRISEVCKLTVDDVDLEGGYLTLQQAKGHKDRVVAMDDDTIAWLRRWEAMRPQQAEYYFCTKKGEQMSIRQLREKVYRISERAGVYIRDGAERKKVHPHTLRHTGLTDMLDQGFNIREVQEMAGHKNLKTTSVYLSVRPESLREKMKKRSIPQKQF
jgi:integrase/recombinase XerD